MYAATLSQGLKFMQTTHAAHGQRNSITLKNTQTAAITTLTLTMHPQQNHSKTTGPECSYCCKAAQLLLLNPVELPRHTIGDRLQPCAIYLALQYWPVPHLTTFRFLIQCFTCIKGVHIRIETHFRVHHESLRMVKKHIVCVWIRNHFGWLNRTWLQATQPCQTVPAQCCVVHSFYLSTRGT